MGYKKANLITILTVAITANLAALTWFGWNSYSSYRDFQAMEERKMKSEELRGIIVHLDEVLTMSARMAAATGDLKWEERYREFEPKLDSAIKEAMTLWPEAYCGRAAAKTDSANVKLVEMENQAFDLVRQGHVKEAHAILFGDEYEDQKQIYSQGMISFVGFHHNYDRLLELRGTIVHLEEVLTMSVRMAAATGNLIWEERYREFEPKLDAAITEAMALSTQLSPQAYGGEATAKTDLANIKLVEMENRAFDLIRQGNSDSAASLLFGDTYEQQKRIYSDGMADFDAVITEIAISYIEREARSTSVITTIVILLSPFLVFTWFIVFRAIRRWRKTLIQHNRLLAQQADELATLNKGLDQKVAERTRESEASWQTAVKARQAAEDANKSLRTENTERKRVEKALRKSEQKMIERVKELHCLYELSQIIETPGISQEDILQQCIRLIPPGWQYPDITCARLLIGGQEYASDNYQETEWKISQNLTVAGKVAGSLDVCYLEERPAADEGPFLKEERNLIRGIIENLQGAIEHKRAEDLQDALFRISESVSQTSDLEGFLRIIHKALGTLTDTTNFYIALYDAEKDSYSFPYCVDQHDERDFTPQQLKKSLTDYVRRTGKPIIANEQTHNMLIDAGEVELVGQASPIWLGVPLRTAKSVIGVAAVQSYSDPKAYSEADLDILSFASDHIALAIERKRAETTLIEQHEALENERANLQAIIDASQVGMLIMDENADVTRVNDVMAKLIGKDVEDFLGHQPGDGLSCVYALGAAEGCGSAKVCSECSIRNTVVNVLQTGEKISGVETRKQLLIDGVERDCYLSVSAAPITLNGMKQVLLAISDTTAEKNSQKARQMLEIEMNQARKLEAVGSLAAGIAHEINTPIQFVGDNTHFLSDAFKSLMSLLEMYDSLWQGANAGGDLTSLDSKRLEAQENADLKYLRGEVPSAVEQTLDGVKRVTKIVRAMKDFAHSDQGTKSMSNLNEMLESTLTVARNELKYVSDVETDFDPVLPEIECYRDNMNQVFLNLLVNAAHTIADVIEDSSAGKGTITVSTRADNDNVIIKVSDTGKGIPQSIQDRVFDPFFSTKDVGKGSGQGLAIARKIIVEEHKGSLDFETEEGKGTTFIIRLPITIPEVVAAP